MIHYSRARRDHSAIHVSPYVSPPDTERLTRDVTQDPNMYNHGLITPHLTCDESNPKLNPKSEVLSNARNIYAVSPTLNRQPNPSGSRDHPVGRPYGGASVEKPTP